MCVCSSYEYSIRARDQITGSGRLSAVRERRQGYAFVVCHRVSWWRGGSAGVSPRLDGRVGGCDWRVEVGLGMEMEMDAEGKEWEICDLLWCQA